MASVPPRRSRGSTRGPLAVAILLALLVHVPLAVWFVHATWLRESPPPPDQKLSVRLIKVSPPEDEAQEEVEDEDPSGQIVEIAPPKNPERPEEADYLAEYDSSVEEETVDPRFRVDREITAETFSPDDAMEEAESQPVDIPTPSTGATAGRKAVFRRGNYSLFPDRKSDWLTTNQPGFSSPVPAAASASRYAGSPSNDMLQEAQSDRTALNAREFLYAAFWNRVKQLVSFYADQTLANARPTVALTKSKYEIQLKGLIAPDGGLAAIEVARGCGIREFDEALLEAFELAAPFPDPPDAAIEADGFIHIRNFHFTIQLTAARAEMSGIDPRSRVQFPGLQTAPR